MSSAQRILQDFRNKLTAPEFEKLIYALLNEMGFSDLVLTGRSGDGGVDLTGVWAPRDFPLPISLDFVIQAKRTSVGKSLNPIFLRALRGTMKPGQYGLLITTSRISPRTREDGLSELSRIVFTMSGSELVRLCTQLETGVKPEFSFSRAFLKPKTELEEPTKPSPAKTFPSELSNMLSTALGERFERVGRTSIYKSVSKTLVARWSQRYRRAGQNYWYGLTPRDLEAVENHNLTHFAYVCSDVGVALFPVSFIVEHVKSNTLGRSPKEGPLRHYHIQLDDYKGDMYWVLKNGVREKVSHFFHKLEKAETT